jgi:hypothetical protein
MAVSDDLTKLAARAKEAEDRVAAAREKTKADLEADRDAARGAGEKEAKAMREAAEERKGQISGRMNDVQRAWSEAVAEIREDLDVRKAEHDRHKAEREAKRAEDYAEFAIDLAYSAIVEAEYAVLDAGVRRMEADELPREPATAA